MLTPRRLYLYLVSAASLAVLVTALATLGAAVIELLFNTGVIPDTYKGSIASAAAGVVVALPIWLLHWTLAQRTAAHDPVERGATLRRLYLYGALSGLAVSLGILAFELLESSLEALVGSGGAQPWVAIARTFWELGVVSVFWCYTFLVADRDRAAVGERGGSATLRRWYAYGAQLVALLIALSSAAVLLAQALMNIVPSGTIAGGGAGTVHAIAATAVGLTIWAFHYAWTNGAALREEDRRTVLRAVQAFLVLAVAVSVTLTGIGQVLHWALSRMLGVPASAQGGDPLDILRSAVSSVLVFGSAWILMRRGIARDAAAAAAERQRGIRRLYEHLVALVSLATFTSGAAVLLWTLVDYWLRPGTALSPSDLPDRVSLAVTLMVVGLPVWLLSWRPSPVIEERAALSRRLYLYVTMSASVLGVLGSGVWLASQALNALLSVPNPQPAVDIGHAVGLLFVAITIGGYHLRIVREDHAHVTARPVPPETPGYIPILVEIAGATEEQVRLALNALPQGATFKLRSI